MGMTLQFQLKHGQNQTATGGTWTEQTNPSTDWTTLGKQDAA
jgi:hypothetical protein